MELVDRGLSFGLGTHGDESKSAAFAREFVLHQKDVVDSTCLPKEVLQVGFRYVKGKIPHVKFVVHTNNCQALPRRSPVIGLKSPLINSIDKLPCPNIADKTAS